MLYNQKHTRNLKDKTEKHYDSKMAQMKPLKAKELIVIFYMYICGAICEI